MQDLQDNVDDDDQESPPGRDAIIILIVFFEAGLAPFALLLGWLFGHAPLEQFHWGIADLGVGVLTSLPMLVLVLVLLRWPIGPFQKLRKLCDDEVVPLLTGSAWYELLMIALSAGVGEETLFRGVIQPAFQSWLADPWLGLALASLVFGLLHPVSWIYVAVATALGGYLGLLLQFNGNLLTPIVAHALYDLAILGYLLKWRPGGSTIDPAGAAD